MPFSSRALLIPPREIEISANKPQVDAILIILLTTPSSLVQMGTVVSPSKIDQPSYQEPQPLIPIITQVAR